MTELTMTADAVTSANEQVTLDPGPIEPLLTPPSPSDTTALLQYGDQKLQLKVIPATEGAGGSRSPSC